MCRFPDRNRFKPVEFRFMNLMNSLPIALMSLTLASVAIAETKPAPTATATREPWSVPVKQTIAVTAPAYCADVKGDTTISFTAKGFSTITARCWKGTGREGVDTTVGTVRLDAEGKGAIVFPADDYPLGPLTVRLSGSNGKWRDNCYLQLYNTGGKPARAGLPEAAPAPAKGMKLVFADDFTKPELSISRTGEGTTYMSHKPGGGDFSGIPFGDQESPAKTPFSQRDTYLRIRADAAKHTTGLIASVNMAGKGITAKAPCYFECRFIAPNAPGTWPAFWIITNRTGAGVKFSDELDVMEGYGGEGAKNPNSRGKYFVTTHYWSQGPGGKGQDMHQEGAGEKRVWMYDLRDGKGSSWFESFHTYGVYVGLDETVYYCDGVPVRRHKTARVSRQYPFYFLVNLAVGGGSRWPIDLSRYNGIADMYVDYVRVYQGESQ
jgi:hypothetical protein